MASVVGSPGSESRLQVGRDFGDAVAGPRRSHGWMIRVNDVTRQEFRHEWDSSLSCAESEWALRNTLSPYMRILVFVSQAIEEPASPARLGSAR